jgi:phosphate acetyltransferase
VSFLEQLGVRAARAHARIAFAEPGDPRVLEAAIRLHREGVATPVLILDATSRTAVQDAAKSGLECIDPASDPRAGALAELLMQLRAKHNLGADEAKRLSRDPLVFADYLLRTGEVHGSVAGAVRTSAEVIRSALWLIGPAAGVRTVSSAFYLCVPGFRNGAPAGETEVLTYTDCSVVPVPTAEQLADIAIAAAAARRAIVGDEPRVALLSYSTRGSGGDGGSIALVREALALIRSRAPELAADGELQADAALIADVAARKAPGSTVAGRANVLVFPSLDAGNIAYKLSERLSGGEAIGPILQGLAKPASDLSRGADARAIFHVAAITALQAQSLTHGEQLP